MPGVTAAKPAAGRSGSSDRLLAAASALMIETNTIDVSLVEIAKRSGLNSALVKYHFGSKDGLLLALLERDADFDMRQLQRLAALDMPATRKLRLHVAGIITAYHRSPYMNRLIHHLLYQSSPDVRRRVSQFLIKPLLDFQRVLVADGVRTGEFAAVDPVLFYLSLIGACDQLFYRRSALAHVAAIEAITDDVLHRYADHVTRMVLGGLRVGETQPV